MSGTAPVPFAILVETDRPLVDRYVEALFAAGIQPIVVPLVSGALRITRLRGTPGLYVVGLHTPRSDELDKLRELNTMAPAPTLVFAHDRFMLDIVWSLRDALGVVMTLPRDAPRIDIDDAIQTALAAAAPTELPLRLIL